MALSKALMDSLIALEWLAKSCQVGASLGLMAKLFDVVSKLLLALITPFPAEMIGSWALWACYHIIVTMVIS